MYRHRFLNRPGHHAGAYTIAEVRVYAALKNRKGHVGASLVIADCSRVVELDFYAADEPSAINALHKARLLREIVSEFTEAYERAIEEWRAQSGIEQASD